MHVKSNFEFFTHELQDSAMTRWQGQNISTSKVQTPASVTLAAAVFSRKSWQIESSCVPNGLVVESGRKKPWLRDSTRSESYAGLGDSWHVLIFRVPKMMTTVGQGFKRSFHSLCVHCTTSSALSGPLTLAFQL